MLLLNRMGKTRQGKNIKLSLSFENVLGPETHKIVASAYFYAYLPAPANKRSDFMFIYLLNIKNTTFLFGFTTVR